jgi:hypothetical protein
MDRTSFAPESRLRAKSARHRENLPKAHTRVNQTAATIVDILAMA